MKSSTRIESSPKNFDVSIDNFMQKDITLDCLTTKNDFERISITAKVTGIGETMKVSGGIAKQDVTIADSTGVREVDSMEGRYWQSHRRQYLSFRKHDGSVIQ